jgi:hypothetical protein
MTNKLAEHFTFLDALRVSGMTCNRFGAAEHLVLAFNLDPTDARRVHAAWMQAPRQSVDVAQLDGDGSENGGRFNFAIGLRIDGIGAMEHD